MTNRIYAYTVVGKDAEPWERTVGQTRTTGTGLIKVGQTTKRDCPRADQAAARHRLPEPRGRRRSFSTSRRRATTAPSSRDHDVHAALVASGNQAAGWRVVRGDARRGQGRDQHGPLRASRSTQAHRVVRDAPRAARRGRAHRRLLPRPAGADRAARSSCGTRRCASARPSPRTSSRWRWAGSGSSSSPTSPRSRPRGATTCSSHVDFEDWHFVDRDTAARGGGQAADGARPARLVRLLPRPQRQDRRRRDQGPQRDDPPHRVGLHRSRRVPLRRLARLGPRPLRPDRQGARRGRGARRPGDRGGPRTRRRALPLPLRHAVPRDHQRRVHRGRDLQLDLRRRAGARRRAGTSADGQNPYIELPRMEMYAYEMREEPPPGPRTASSTASRSTSTSRRRGPIRTSRASGPGRLRLRGPDRVSEFLEMLRGKLSDQMKVQIVAGAEAAVPVRVSRLHRRRSSTPSGTCPTSPRASRCATCSTVTPTSRASRSSSPRVRRRARARRPSPRSRRRSATATKNNRSGSITLSCGKLMTGVTSASGAPS